jgi:HSP20 family protein
MADTQIDVKRTSSSTPAPARPATVDMFHSLRDEFDRIFDQVWSGFGLPTFRSRFGTAPAWRHEPMSEFLAPSVDVSEDEKAYHITADLPGLSEQDVNVSLSGDMLTISADKTEEKEEKERNYHFTERRSGSFRRSFSLPAGVDREAIAATLKNGVLSLMLPKTQEAQQQQKKIEVKGG